jgi:DNA-directed RNA polymerase delta subunit
MLLPMRLKEDLSYLSKSYTEEKFNEKPCYKLTFSYPPVGENETWYFFISKEDFRLEGYQFFQKDILSDGEFIYLSDYKWIKGLLVPKVKKWYWNKDGSFFRTDTILATR